VTAIRHGTSPTRKLTRREREVLAALCAPLAEGGAFVEPASSKDMADALGVSEAAVKQHLLSLYDKFQIPEGEERRRTRLANKAVEAHLVGDAAPERPSQPREPEALDLARRAAALRNWPRAFEELSRLPASSIEGSAEAQELLGETALWSGQPDVAIAARQRAYALHAQAGQAERAALVALGLVVNSAMRNQVAQASGWLAKARRHLEPNPAGLPLGYLLLVESIFAMFGGELAAAAAAAARALASADQAGDIDLRGLSLSVQGYSLALIGRADEARPMLDEAMASAIGGELGTYATGFVYCRTVCASLDTLDYRRALEWTDAIERAGSDVCLAGFPGDCRAHRATIFMLRGDWQAGEREATLASAESRATDLRHAGIAENELGTLRLRSGDFEAAEAAFLLAHQLGYPPQPGLSLLHSARGDHVQALAMLRTAVERTPAATPLRGMLLAALVEVALAALDLRTAAAAHDELTTIATARALPFLDAAATTAGGALLLAQGKSSAARDALRGAVASWLGASAPFEAACARLHLARALDETADRSAAALELSAARTVFERLGAKPALESAERALAAFRHED